ncbi:hypothetical protein L9F63_012939, partial [Diploptera punctata]
MAGKKGQVVQLQLEVNTNEEWQKLLETDGLIVVDIYSEWCGPCIGMTGTLKRIKLEIGGDFLTFAIAKSDDIDCLERFRNRSEPTWMFIAGGQMVNLMLGADAPRLTNLIIKEIEKEKRVLEGQSLREAIPFDQLTPEEEVRFEEKEKIRRAAREQEEAALGEMLEQLDLWTPTDVERLALPGTVMTYFEDILWTRNWCNQNFKIMTDYKHCLFENHSLYMEQYLVLSQNHTLYTDRITLPHGYKGVILCLQPLIPKRCIALLLLFQGPFAVNCSVVPFFAYPPIVENNFLFHRCYRMLHIHCIPLLVLAWSPEWLCSDCASV